MKLKQQVIFWLARSDGESHHYVVSPTREEYYPLLSEPALNPVVSAEEPAGAEADQSN